MGFKNCRFIFRINARLNGVFFGFDKMVVSTVSSEDDNGKADKTQGS